MWAKTQVTKVKVRAKKAHRAKLKEAQELGQLTSRQGSSKVNRDVLPAGGLIATRTSPSSRACASCKVQKPAQQFSSSQWRVRKERSRCTSCILSAKKRKGVALKEKVWPLLPSGEVPIDSYGETASYNYAHKLATLGHTPRQVSTDDPAKIRVRKLQQKRRLELKMEKKSWTLCNRRKLDELELQLGKNRKPGPKSKSKPEYLISAPKPKRKQQKKKKRAQR